MDYINLLVKANRALLKKCKELQNNSNNDFVESDCAQLVEKCDKLNKENLSMKERIAKLELSIYSLNKELEKKNTTIISLKSQL